MNGKSRTTVSFLCGARKKGKKELAIENKMYFALAR